MPFVEISDVDRKTFNYVVVGELCLVIMSLARSNSPLGGGVGCTSAFCLAPILTNGTDSRLGSCSTSLRKC